MAGNDLRSFTDARLLMDRSVKRLHSARHNAHNEFDLLWKEGLMPRRTAYFFLQYLLGITDHAKAHFAHISPDECNEVINKLRTSSTLPRFFRFLKHIQFNEQSRIRKIMLPELTVDAYGRNFRYCIRCHRWKNKVLFDVKKMKCSDCRSGKSPQWIGTREYIIQVQERLKKEQIPAPDSAFEIRNS